jgi:hypothetical protein
MTNRWLVVSLAGVLTAVSSIVAFSAPSSAQAVASSELATLHASASPPPPAHSLALGPLAASRDLHIDVTLKLPDPSVRIPSHSVHPFRSNPYTDSDVFVHPLRRLS